ncbi:MAG TPA: PRC-barrel domain-containing protein [Candidatus Sulfotelmatobacter sp.]|nr:PRC-barrel domain-containing protein [Candidatus Sulfotelmatobacter sp.]
MSQPAHGAGWLALCIWLAASAPQAFAGDTPPAEVAQPAAPPAPSPADTAKPAATVPPPTETTTPAVTPAPAPSPVDSAKPTDATPPAPSPDETAKPAATAPPQASPPPPGKPAELKNLQPIFPGEATTILGKQVEGAAGEDMGRVVDVLVDGDGQPRAAIIDFGGFLGVGSRKIAVDWRLLQFRPTDHKAPVRLSVTRAEVQAAPEYKEQHSEPAQVVVPPAAAPAPSPTSPATAGSSAAVPAPAPSPASPATATPPAADVPPVAAPPPAAASPPAAAK